MFNRWSHNYECLNSIFMFFNKQFANSPNIFKLSSHFLKYYYFIKFYKMIILSLP